ncbi:MAG: protein kinase [Acidobacteria bacterium]|jgi:non-specific serine/threonine protein kinase|nr:protein kinase [Acidobacteriota bacterium]
MIGTTISHYRILEKLGEGGMGEVYCAEDTTLGRKVALKVLPREMAQKPDRLQRFRREARAVAALNHPNIVTIYAVEEVDGVPFLTMELVEGESLQSRVTHGGLPLEKILEVAGPLAEALAAAHERGITHRDLKPANIMFDREGRPKVLDFGLAKLHEDSSPGDDEPTAVPPSDLTQAGAVLGTLPYMSPEQVQGRPADHRSDVFSLGAILYELATGERPFRGETSADLISSILRDRPRELTELRADIPDHLGRIVRRCLDKDPARRYQTGRDLQIELEDLGAQGKSGAKRGASVAVLPFADMSAEKDQDYFCEGIAEELINGLGRIENLRVASRTSSFQFKGTALDVREIGRRLDVSTVLEGSVRKAGDRLRITAQLANVDDGYRLWSDRYDREMKDVFAIQDEIAESIVAALEVTLSPKERRALQNVATRDVEAYEYYLRGRKFFYQMNEKAFEFSRQMYGRAIEIDPAYALAYTGIADCCSFLYQYADSSEANLKGAEQASRKALDLDPDLAEAHASRGLALSLGGTFEEAEAEFEEALRRDPRLYEAYYFYGRACLAHGRYDKATELFGKACEVRPESYEAPSFLEQALRGLGAPQEKIERASRRTVELVERHVELNPDDARALYLGGGCLLTLGDRERAMEWGRRARAIDPGDPMILYNVACLFSQAGESEPAIEALEGAVDAGFGHREWIEHDSDFDPVRESPRFQKLLARL